MSRLSLRLAGRANDEMLARELGRDDSESNPPGLRLGSGPKESRLTPEVERRGTCFPTVPALKLWLVGVVSSGAAADEATEPVVRFLDRIVTVEGTIPAPMPAGEERGGVPTGAGNLERTDCTRASSRCIWAVRERTWERELDGGMRCEVERVALVAGGRGAGVRTALLVTTRAPCRELVDELKGVGRGFGVTLWSAEGNRILRWAAETGVLTGGTGLAFGSGAEASDMGGEGGS